MSHLVNVPNELKAYNNWICWKTIKREDRIDKIPVATTGKNASTNDSKTWTSFEEALSYYDSHDSEVDGIGFVFSSGDPFCGVDFDKCRNPETGEIDEWALKWIKEFNSYTEVSPSFKGAHVITKGKKKGDKCRKDKVEIYDKERFFTITGDVLDGYREIQENQEVLNNLYDAVFTEQNKKQSKRGSATALSTKPKAEVSLDDQALIEKAMNAKDGAKFTALWEGDISGYDSHSEADLALCSLLAFWTGGDYERIDRLFRQSGLYREKWDRDDYRETTINNAIESTTEFYNPSQGKVGRLNETELASTIEETQFLPTFTEGWLSRKFVELRGDNLRYCYVWDKWIIWTGRRWEIDNTGEVYRKARDVIKKLLKEASETDDDKTRKALSGFAHKSDTRSKYSAIIELSKCEVPILPEDFDTDPMLFNCSNGTIDLRIGELREHRREDYITKLALVKFDPNAKAPRWEKFLNEIFQDNQSIIEFLQRAVGYALTGEIREQILLILYGTGANGKTTFLETLLNIFGDYGKPAEQDLLIVKRHEQHPTGVADLMGARFVSAMEIGEGKRLNEALVKRLTGKDRLKARFMRQDFFEFEPTHKIFMAVNHKPHIRGTDTGIWRRIRLIPFAVEIPEHKQDKQLQERLVKEASGILAWAVRGCLAWQEQGLGITTEIEKATNEYRVEMDTIGAFITECCIEGDNYKAKASELYECYCNWCDKSREQAIPQKNFAFYLTEKGFERRRLKNGYHWFGVGILDTKGEPSNDGDERSFTHDKHSDNLGLSDSDIQKVNPGEPKSILYATSIDLASEYGTGFTTVHPNSDETNSDKGLDRVNDPSPSEQKNEHNGGLSEKLDEYLTKCPDDWVKMIQDGIKQKKFTSLGIAIEASRRMSNGDSQGACRLIRQNGG